jgi:hypothetical protein
MRYVHPAEGQKRLAPVKFEKFKREKLQNVAEVRESLHLPLH